MARDHCPFRKPILGGTCGCSFAAKTHLPTGCSVTCKDDAAWDRCEKLLEHFITAGQFALHYVDGTDSLTHGKLMKVQHGGLLGLSNILNDENVQVSDIHELVDKALTQYGAIGDIPVESLLPYIKAHENRRRKNK